MSKLAILIIFAIMDKLLWCFIIFIACCCVLGFFCHILMLVVRVSPTSAHQPHSSEVGGAVGITSPILCYPSLMVDSSVGTKCIKGACRFKRRMCGIHVALKIWLPIISNIFIILVCLICPHSFFKSHWPFWVVLYIYIFSYGVDSSLPVYYMVRNGNFTAHHADYRTLFQYGTAFFVLSTTQRTVWRVEQGCPFPLQNAGCYRHLISCLAMRGGRSMIISPTHLILISLGVR